MTIINTNARSLCPKINSLIDCFGELEASIGIITGTGESLRKDVRDMEIGAEIGMIYRNRDTNNRGIAHGGVAITSDTAVCSVTKIDMPNPMGPVCHCASHMRTQDTLSCPE